MNKTGLSVRLIQYALLLLCFFSMNIFAEERKAFDFLSGLQQLGANFDQTEQELLPPDQAFKLTVRVRDENTLVAQFEPAKDYYLYRDKVAFKPQNSETSIEKISLPMGQGIVGEVIKNGQNAFIADAHHDAACYQYR